MPTTEALAKGQGLGLDLVELSPNAEPPVCRLMDHGKYVFEVDPRANKLQIKEAVEIGFDVVVRKVNVMNVRGRFRRIGRRGGREADWKKAVVTLTEGHEIKLFEGV